MRPGLAYTESERDRFKAEKNALRQEARNGPFHCKVDTPDRYGHGGNRYIPVNFSQLLRWYCYFGTLLFILIGFYFFSQRHSQYSAKVFL